MSRNFVKEEVRGLAERLYVAMLLNKRPGDTGNVIAQACIRSAMIFRLEEDKIFKDDEVSKIVKELEQPSE